MQESFSSYNEAIRILEERGYKINLVHLKKDSPLQLEALD